MLDGAGGSWITVTATLTGTEVFPGVFDIDPNGVINIYANTIAAGDDLAGTGFDAGKLILTATSNGIGVGSLVLDTSGTPVVLDNFNGDSYSDAQPAAHPKWTCESAGFGDVLR